jgi:hypothetical protein
MEAGRKLDALVAEKVMGWKDKVLTTEDEGIAIIESFDNIFKFSPSTNIADAWKVVEKIQEKFWIKLVGYGEGFICTLTGKGDNTLKTAVDETTAPLAICLAALEAVGYDIQEEQHGRT